MKKIVIIDDSNPFVMLVKHLLEDEQVLVDSFEDAVDFLRIPSRIAAYDLIILDINLPGMNGLQVLDELKSKPATRDVPVLLLSGDSRSEIVVKGIRRGAIDFLTKPVDPPQLLERVMKHLQPEGKTGSDILDTQEETDHIQSPFHEEMETESSEPAVTLTGDHQLPKQENEDHNHSASQPSEDNTQAATTLEQESSEAGSDEADKITKTSISDAADSK
ncbi:response regulator [Paenibacillus kandeliae]|uniref:response regulator n=1 Tax=Paenibacillus kandeliae TaxID=3231269 RepID=UPI003459723F